MEKIPRALAVALAQKLHSASLSSLVGSRRALPDGNALLQLLPWCSEDQFSVMLALIDATCVDELAKRACTSYDTMELWSNSRHCAVVYKHSCELPCVEIMQASCMLWISVQALCRRHASTLLPWSPLIIHHMDSPAGSKNSVISWTTVGMSLERTLPR